MLFFLIAFLLSHIQLSSGDGLNILNKEREKEKEKIIVVTNETLKKKLKGKLQIIKAIPYKNELIEEKKKDKKELEIYVLEEEKIEFLREKEEELKKLLGELDALKKEKAELLKDLYGLNITAYRYSMIFYPRGYIIGKIKKIDEKIKLIEEEITKIKTELSKIKNI
ncbi:MAG: hypothetical protein AB1410_01250 [Acidobacteriota bacterium]